MASVETKVAVKVKTAVDIKRAVEVVRVVKFKVVEVIEVRQNEYCSFLEDVVRDSGAEFCSCINVRQKC